ncbi:hypothetical protein D3C81_1644700 [compost metagenome]
MTQLIGNKCRAHTRHEAHSSVCVSAVVLPTGANVQFTQCGLEVFVGHAGLLDELKILGRREHKGRLRVLSAALAVALVGHLFGFLNGVQGPAVEHHLPGVFGLGTLLDLVIRHDAADIDQALLLIDRFPTQCSNLARAHTGIEGELKVGGIDPH